MNIFKRGKGTDVSNRRREKGAGVAGRFAVETKKADDSVVLGATAPERERPESRKDELVKNWHEESLWQADGGADWYEARLIPLDEQLTYLSMRTGPGGTLGEVNGEPSVLAGALRDLSKNMYNDDGDSVATALEIAKTRAMLHDQFRDASLAESAPVHADIDRDLGIMQQYLIDTWQDDRDPAEALPTGEEAYNKRWDEAQAHLAAYDGTGPTPDQGRRAAASNAVAEDLTHLRRQAHRTGSKLHGLAAATAAELPYKLVAARNAEEALEAIYQTRFDLGEAAYKVGAAGEAGRDSFGELHDTLNSMETLVAMEMRKPAPVGSR